MSTMAPVGKFTKPPDLSGRTPIYRLSKPPIPRPVPQSQPTPPLPVNNNPVQPSQPPYHASPYHSPYPSSHPPPPHATPQDDKENAPAQTPTEARGSPLTKRRGRKLQEDETLILVNCCLEYQSMYHDNPSRFWFCVSTSLKRQIKRNFSWQSCRQIIEELVAERRERRRDVAGGKVKEQPLTETVIATDKWIAFTDAGAASSVPLSVMAGLGQPLKRPGQTDDSDSPMDPNAAKRLRQNENDRTTPYIGPPRPPMPQVSQAMPPAHPMQPPVPTVPSGPTISEFQSMKVDIQSLRMDLQNIRREMVETRHEVTNKLDLILRSLAEAKVETQAEK
ncbi:hypothetical protein BJX99DRAFT_164343 [Aspergillus californicus]